MSQIKRIFFIVSFFLLTSCGANKEVLSNAEKTVSKLDYTYIDKFHEGLRLKQKGEIDYAIKAFEKCCTMKQTDAAVAYVLSGLYGQKGDLIKASSFLEKAVLLDPSNKWYVQEYTYLSFEQNNFKEAVLGFEKLLKFEPTNIEWLYGYAEALMKNGDYKKAITAIEHTEEQVGQHPELAIQKFKLLVALKKPEKGVEEINKAIKLFPDEPVLIGTLVDYYFQTRQNTKAIEMLEMLTEKEPENGRAHLGLADIYRQMKRFDDYISELEKAFVCTDIDIDMKMKMLIDIQDKRITITPTILSLASILVEQHPSDAKSHSILGDFLLETDDKKGALAAYKEALKFDKSRFAIWNQVLLMEYQNGDFVTLFEESKTCIELFPSQTTVYLLAGLAANQTKMFKEAIEFLTIGKDLIIDNKQLQSEFYGQIGEAYFGLNQFTEGKTSYEFALNFSQNSTLNLNNYAYRLALAKIDLARAEELIQKAIAISPNQPHFIDTYGWVLFQKENYIEANKLFLRAFELDALDKVIVEHVGDSYFKIGNTEKALEYWKKSKELGSSNKVLDNKIEKKAYYEPIY